MVLAILVALGVLLLAGGVLAWLVWFNGWDVGRRFAPQRAGLTEAGERTADRLAEFRDWVRLGR